MNAPPLDQRVTVLEYEVRQLKLRLARVEHGGTGVAPVSLERTPRAVPEDAPAHEEPAAAFITPPTAVQPGPPNVEAARPADLPVPPPLPGDVPAPRGIAQPVEHTPGDHHRAETLARKSFDSDRDSVIAARTVSAVADVVGTAVTKPSLGERLRGWGLLPPADGNREVALGAWWATRIGALLGVLAAVFLAVYVSINTPPWVRWLELLAVALGVTAAGLRFDRTIERFGRVVLGCGLSLIYFTAVAGYAVAGVRVFHDLGSAAVAQAAAIAILLAISLWKNSEKLTALSVGYGVVAALWARSLDNPALGWTALSVLLGISLALRNVRQWALPALLAVPAAYFALLIDVRRLPGAGAGFAIVGFAWLITWLTEVRLARANAGDRTAARVLLSFNASGALIACAGLTTHRFHGHGDLVSLVTGLICLGAAYVHFRLVPARWGFAWHYTKGASLLILATILHFDGPARWFSLLAQAFLWLFSARRNDSRLLLGGSTAAACIAALTASQGWDGDVFATHSVSWGFAWLALAGTWVHLLLRGGASPLLSWRRGNQTAPALDVLDKPTTTEVVSTVALIVLGLHFWLHTNTPSSAALVAALSVFPLALAAKLLRERVALVTAAVAALVGGLWVLPPVEGLPWQPVLAALLLSGSALAAGMLLLKRFADRAETLAPYSLGLGAAGTLLAVVAAAHSGLGVLTLAIAALLGCGFYFLQAGRPATAPWGAGAALGAPLGFLVARSVHGPLAVEWTHHACVLVTSALLALLPPLLARRRLNDAPWAPAFVARKIEAGYLGLWSLATFVSLHDGIEGVTPTFTLFALLTALVLAGTAGWWRTPTGRVHASAWLAVAFLNYLMLRVDAPTGVAVQQLCVLFGGTFLASGVLAHRWAAQLREETRGPLLWATAALATLLLADAGWLLRGPAHSYVTAAWGVTGVAIFAGGLFGRWRPWRLCGLALLGAATLRLFAIDITSTLSRIFAFAALAVVLLTVGFLYQKFQARIEKE